MEFVNRENELQLLEELYGLSFKRLFPVLIYGPRRIGKTELIKYFSKDKKHVYFFIYGLKTPQSLLNEFEIDLKREGILGDREALKNFDDFLDIIMERCEGKIVIFDEFQNFRETYPAIFSSFQRKIDENQNKRIMLVFLGSIVGLIKGVFEDIKSPLYGRLKAKLKIEPLRYSEVRHMLKHLGYSKEEEFVTFYSIFGGYPKYYVAMEDFGLKSRKVDKILEVFFLRDNSVFGYEVLDILRQEFGKRKGTYYTVLEAIATGHTKLSEIASYAGMSVNSVSRYIGEIIEYYELMERIIPVTEKRSSKKSIYRIKNPLVKFWFRYFYKNLSLFEGKSYETLKKIVLKDMDSFVGEGFEEICRQFLKDLNLKDGLPFKFTSIGRWWHKDREIDILTLDTETKKILFVECKWRKRKTDVDVLKSLIEKARDVKWYNQERKEYYAVISKSGFTAKAKRYADEGNILTFSLNDIKSFYDAG
ncbi:ATP-binding protein [Candidatus Pyrohabitans sp.]